MYANDTLSQIRVMYDSRVEGGGSLATLRVFCLWWVSGNSSWSKQGSSRSVFSLQLMADGQGADALLERAEEEDVAFLVVGDPFGYAPADLCLVVFVA